MVEHKWLHVRSREAIEPDISEFGKSAEFNWCVTNWLLQPCVGTKYISLYFCILPSCHVQTLTVKVNQVWRPATISSRFSSLIFPDRDLSCVVDIVLLSVRLYDDECICEAIWGHHFITVLMLVLCGGKHFGGFKRHFIQSKVFPGSKHCPSSFTHAGRVEICRVRHDRRSLKFFPGGVILRTSWAGHDE